MEMVAGGGDIEVMPKKGMHRDDRGSSTKKEIDVETQKLYYQAPVCL